jgi:hypothetical protein
MTWTPATQQNETWTAENPVTRTFSPYTFSRRPVFDTGPTAGVWDARTQQIEVWTAET